MLGIDVLRLTTGERLSFDNDGTTVETYLDSIEMIHVGPRLERFTIKFKDETGQQWVLTDQTKELKCTSMSEQPKKKSLPMLKEDFMPPVFIENVNQSKDDLYSLLIEEMIKEGVDKKVVATAAKNLAMKLTQKNDELELFCWRLYGKYTYAPESKE